MTNELYHVGMPGRSGRYPWGSGDRPYQRLEGKKAKKSSGLFKKKKKAPENRPLTPEEIKKRAAERKEAVKKGSATNALKFQGEFTNAELEKLTKRIDLERKLVKQASEEAKTNMQKIDKAMQTLKSVNEWGKIGTDTYNLLANFYNATEEGKKNPWPTISKGGGGEGKKKKGND